ncbi:MAG: hypothetical protein EXX96DRAFT_540252 [Benjaminiella poitrasii]|nr:MAG: hypothetical protein EXX96DRAFT_540252 [Benjaminiella poitrasii]
MTDKSSNNNNNKPTKKPSRTRTPATTSNPPSQSTPSSRLARHHHHDPSHRHHPYQAANKGKQADRSRRAEVGAAKPAPPPPSPKRRQLLLHPRVRQLRLPDEGAGRVKLSKHRRLFKQQQKRHQPLQQFLTKYQCTGETMEQMERRLWLEFNVPLGPLKARDLAGEAEERKRRKEFWAREYASLAQLEAMAEKRAEGFRQLEERYQRNRPIIRRLLQKCAWNGLKSPEAGNQRQDDKGKGKKRERKEYEEEESPGDNKKRK